MSTKIRVLHYSTHNEDCGIAKYQEQYFDGMQEHDDIENAFFQYSPNQVKVLPASRREEIFAEMRQEMANYDILHIQHEYGFFTENDFALAVKAAKEAGKKVVVTIHTSPGVVMRRERLMGLGPRSFMHYAKYKLRLKRFMQRQIEPLKSCELLIVHNFPTKESLMSFGVPEDRIARIMHPVPKVKSRAASTFISEKLRTSDKDVVYCIIGFLHKNKGVFDAIRALKFLPENYKLAVLGGVHPFSDDIRIYNDLADEIDRLNLHDRVYITGFIKDDATLDSYIQECDVCVFPYDRDYYASVSSGSLNLAFSNSKPVVAYPTQSFVEMNEFKSAIIMTSTFAYYELAKVLKTIKPGEQPSEDAHAYIEMHSWPNQASKIADTYRSIL